MPSTRALLVNGVRIEAPVEGVGSCEGGRRKERFG